MKLNTLREKLFAYTWDLDGIVTFPPFLGKYARFLDWTLDIRDEKGMPVSMKLYTKPGLEEMDWNYGLEVASFARGFYIHLANNQDASHFEFAKFRIKSIEDNKMIWKTSEGKLLTLKGIPHKH